VAKSLPDYDWGYDVTRTNPSSKTACVLMSCRPPACCNDESVGDEAINDELWYESEGEDEDEDDDEDEDGQVNLTVAHQDSRLITRDQDQDQDPDEVKPFGGHQSAAQPGVHANQDQDQDQYHEDGGLAEEFIEEVHGQDQDQDQDLRVEEFIEENSAAAAAGGGGGGGGGGEADIMVITDRPYEEPPQ